jgi:hypothetical protein
LIGPGPLGPGLFYLEGDLDALEVHDLFDGGHIPDDLGSPALRSPPQPPATA